MKRTNGRIFGFWFDGDLYCPLCFSDLGRLLSDEIIFMDSIDAHFGECHRCKWPLWGLHKYEKYLDRSQVVKKRFVLLNNFSNLDALILKEEVELLTLQIRNTNPSILEKGTVDFPHEESTISAAFFDELLFMPRQKNAV
jgi:hypothetical protein